MPYSLRIRNLPVFSPSDPAQWIIGTCGTFLAASGGGWAKIEQDPAALVGTSIWQWAGEREDVRKLVARVLAGASYDGTIEYGGLVWYISCMPLAHPERGVMGCACTAYPLVPGGELPAPPEPEAEPVAEVYEAAGDNSRYHIWSGDQFEVDGDAVIQKRRIPRAYFLEAKNSAPERMHLIRPSSALPAPPRLRLLA
jgi:hypothetical protein